jgi:hypothetical protein
MSGTGTPPDERDSHPNRGTLGQPPMGGDQRLHLSAQQLHEQGDGPSWKAPRPPRARWSRQRIVTLVILLAILALVIYLKATGVV